MNCTHHLTFTPARQKMMEEAYAGNPKLRDLIVKLFTVPAEIDMRKFGISSVMHDVNCALYLLHPEQYETKQGNVLVMPKDDREIPESATGNTEFTENPNGNVKAAFKIKDPDAMFKVVLDSIKKLVPPSSEIAI